MGQLKKRVEKPVRRVLICRTDNIGDVVLTLPLAGCLRERIPEVSVDFLCRAYAAPIAKQCRHVGRVLELEAHPEMVELFQHYDTVIFAFPDRRLAHAARRARVARRIGTSHRWYHWYTCNQLAHFSRKRSTLHEAQLNFKLLKPLGIDVVPTFADISNWYGLTAPADKAVQPLRSASHFHLILHPKSNGNGREWPIASYEALADSLRSHPDVIICITGSAAEGEVIAREAPRLLAMPHVRNMCGLLDLPALCTLIAKVDGIVASGTGPLHLGAALGQRVLGLFPPIRPIHAGRWAPIGAEASWLSAPSRCVTCTGSDGCSCMAAIEVSDVVEIVNHWRSQQLKVA